MDAGPPPEAYGRVTNPERFQPICDAAAALVDELVATYDVVLEEELTPERRLRSLRTIRLTPTGGGAPIEVTFTDFPGVVVRFGRWSEGGFPACGCDACDDDPTQVVEELRETVAHVVAGRFQEAHTDEPALVVEVGPSRSWQSLIDGPPVEPERSEWRPWSRRDHLTPWP